MKRLCIMALVAVTAVALALPAAAFAESYKGSDAWTVTFNEQAEKDNKLIDEFSQKEWEDEIKKLEPGDDITFTVTQVHDHATSADWYMDNEVLKTLEEGDQEGSAYGYVLTYINPSGESRELYNSDTVGGDSSKGLIEATGALKDFFYLDTLKKGQKSKVTLKVSLDGETEGNAYFDTLAQLKMRFAVELNETETKPNPDTPKQNTTTNTVRSGPVQTGDSTNLFPFYVAMTASGALLMLIAIWSLRRRKREK